MKNNRIVCYEVNCDKIISNKRVFKTFLQYVRNLYKTGVEAGSGIYCIVGDKWETRLYESD